MVSRKTPDGSSNVKLRHRLNRGFVTLRILILLILLLPCINLAAFAEGAENAPFAEWLLDIRSQALERGLAESTVAVLDVLEPDRRVLRFDKSQPEFVQTLGDYLDARVTQYRITTAKRFYQEHQDNH